MVEELQNTSNSRKAQDKEIRFLLIYLLLFLKYLSLNGNIKIEILRKLLTVILLTL